MASDFAPEVAKYPRGSPKPQNFGRVRAYCFAPLEMQVVTSAVNQNLTDFHWQLTRTCATLCILRWHRAVTSSQLLLLLLLLLRFVCISRFFPARRKKPGHNRSPGHKEKMTARSVCRDRGVILLSAITPMMAFPDVICQTNQLTATALRKTNRNHTKPLM